MHNIYLRLPPGSDQTNQKVMIIGDNNVFEVGSCTNIIKKLTLYNNKVKLNRPIFLFYKDSEALKIGDNNTLESKCELRFLRFLIYFEL
jgi:hypothetical protein